MIHLTQNGKDAICDNVMTQRDKIITIEEAMNSEGKYYDCRDCHIKLTGGRPHSRL